MTDASVNMTAGMLTVPTLVQANLLKCSHRPPPQVTARTWHHFEKCIKGLTDGQHGCLFGAIIGNLPVQLWWFNDLCNLLLDETPIFASTDG